MSFLYEIGEMRCFFIANLKKEKFIFSCPNNIKAITVSDVNSIFYSLRESALKNKINKGKINSIDGFYFYFVICKRIIVIVNTNLVYKDEILMEFVNKIVNYQEKSDFNSSISLESLENLEIRLQEFKFRERIYKLFECYKLLDEKFNEFNYEQIDVSHYFTKITNKTFSIHNTRRSTVKILLILKK